jgi:2-polyprenyl-3-methyl-5-hydroxy-6-metoxy-1,4-benzoquinol methylase
MKDKITLSNSTVKLIESIQNTINEKYIEYEFKDKESEWINSYNIIKGESWPGCNSYQDFNSLSKDIKEECVNIHHFSPEIFKDSIINDANAKLFPISNTSKFELDDQILINLNNNLDIIQGKKILDLACHFGHWSFFAHYNQCSDAVGIDVRKENLNVARSIQQDLKISDSQIKFMQADLHDHKQVEEICSDRDTVFLLGIMYHIHDHYDLLKAVCQQSVKNIVIETAVPHEIIDVDMPLIWWKHEPTFELISGFYDDHARVLVGYPNVFWFDLVMKEFGFNRVVSSTKERYSSTQQMEKFKQFRSFFLYKK